MFIKNKIAINAGWIVLCKIIQAVLNLIVTMIMARNLGPSNYGLINYAISVVTFFVPIMQLGLNSTLVNEFVINPDDEGKIIGTSFVLSSISSIFCIIGIYGFSIIANKSEKQTTIVCLLYSTQLFFYGLEMIQYWFQSKLYSKYTSIVMLIAYAIVAIYKVYTILFLKSIYMLALAETVNYCIISLVLIIIYKSLNGKKIVPSLKQAKKLFSRSRYYIVSTMMVMIFNQTDKVMLKLMANDAATGYYSAGVTCATMTSFVFVAIIDSFRPTIFEAKLKSQTLFENRMTSLYTIIIYFSLLQSLAITLLAKPIIYIMYGKKYFNSINALRIIVWFTTFSYLGTVRNIWILAEEHQKYMWVINFSGALANVIINYILIPPFGIIGASVASLITQVFTNVIIGYIIKPIRQNNHLMIRALNLSNFYKNLKDLYNT